MVAAQPVPGRCARLFLVGWGVRALYRTPVDAIPDLSENQVIVFADWPGRSPAGGRGPGDLSALGQPAGLAGVKTVRATPCSGSRSSP